MLLRYLSLTYFRSCISSSICLPPVSPEGSVSSSPSPVLVSQTHNTTLNCSSSGGPDNMYQWFHEGSILPGETNPTLTLTDVMVSNEGNYICRVSNAAGSGNSTTAIVGEFYACTCWYSALPCAFSTEYSLVDVE